MKNMGISILKVPKSITIAPKASGDRILTNYDLKAQMNDTKMGLSSLKKNKKSRNKAESSILFSTDNKITAEKGNGFGSPFLEGKGSPMKSLDKIKINESQGEDDLNFKNKPKAKEPVCKGIQTFDCSERNGVVTPDKNSKSWSIVSAGSNVFHIDGSNLKGTQKLFVNQPRPLKQSDPNL